MTRIPPGTRWTKNIVHHIRLRSFIRMTDLARAYTPESKPAEWRGLRERFPLLPLLRKGVASDGPAWLPLVLVFGGFGAVACADQLAVRILLVCLTIPPLGLPSILCAR